MNERQELIEKVKQESLDRFTDIQFLDYIEFEKAGEVLFSEKLPFEMLGDQALTVSKNIANYLDQIYEIKFKPYNKIIRTAYIMDKKELERICKEREQERKKGYRKLAYICSSEKRLEAHFANFEKKYKKLDKVDRKKIRQWYLSKRKQINHIMKMTGRNLEERLSKIENNLTEVKCHIKEEASRIEEIEDPFGDPIMYGVKFKSEEDYQKAEYFLSFIDMKGEGIILLESERILIMEKKDLKQLDKVKLKYEDAYLIKSNCSPNMENEVLKHYFS